MDKNHEFVMWAVAMTIALLGAFWMLFGSGDER